MQALGYDGSMKKKHLWVDFTSAELAQLSGPTTVAVLPLGAVEQHGPHLPLGVDVFLVEAFVAQALALSQPSDAWVVLPSLQVGHSVEHLDFPGTLNMSPQWAMAQCMSLAKSVAAVGISKLLLFNAHGGNAGLMDVVGRDIRKETGLHVFHTNWYDLADADVMHPLFGAQELKFGIHAGDTETSLMLAIRPDLVNTELLAHHSSASEQKARHFPILGNGRSVKQSWMAVDYSTSGAMGNASLATAEKGRQVLDHVGLRLIELVREISRF
jgi:creatinine amidohydrolase